MLAFIIYVFKVFYITKKHIKKLYLKTFLCAHVYFLLDFIAIIIVVINPPYNTVEPNIRNAIAVAVILIRLAFIIFYTFIFPWPSTN